MCANYQPPLSRALCDYFLSLSVEFEYASEAYPGTAVPILLPSGQRDDERLPARALFGLVPFWAKDLAAARRTYNARSETVARLASFRRPWQRGQRCLVPVQRFYEFNYESGKAVRWAIERADGQPFALAGLWETWQSRPVAVAATAGRDDEATHDREDVGASSDVQEQAVATPPTGPVRSCSMLTIDAEHHPLMRRFHAPGDEKRSVVVLDTADHEAWLRTRDDAEARALLRPFDPQAFVANPAPRARTRAN